MTLTGLCPRIMSKDDTRCAVFTQASMHYYPLRRSVSLPADDDSLLTPLIFASNLLHVSRSVSLPSPCWNESNTSLSASTSMLRPPKKNTSFHTPRAQSSSRRSTRGDPSLAEPRAASLRPTQMQTQSPTSLSTSCEVVVKFCLVHPRPIS